MGIDKIDLFPRYKIAKDGPGRTRHAGRRQAHAEFGDHREPGMVNLDTVKCFAGRHVIGRRVSGERSE